MNLIDEIDGQNRLLWNRHDGRADGSFKWAEPENGSRHGPGRQARLSGGDGLIYDIDRRDRLLWNRHDGRGDGSFKWAEPENRQVGTGWDVKHVSPAERPDLLDPWPESPSWNRHDGRDDGSFSGPSQKPASRHGLGRWACLRRRRPIYYIDGQNRLCGTGTMAW